MNRSMSKALYRKKRFWIPLLIILVLVVFRLFLPRIVKHYVNEVLAEIPGYYGQVENIDIAIVRGAYAIDGLYLNKSDAGSEVPFLRFERADISVEWDALWKGKIVSEVVLDRPELIYVFEDQQQNGGDGTEAEDWSKALTDLVPIDINRLQINNGKMAFVEVQAEPTIDLDIHNVEITATNLRNVVSEELTLPSEIHATGISFGNGNLRVDGKMNLVKEVPDMDVALSLEKADVTALNDLTRHYAGLDFEEGTFELFIEMAIADGYLEGSLKPLLKNSKLVGKDEGFFKGLWEGFVGFFKFILKNQKNNTLATKVPLQGDLNNVGAKIWPTVTNIFKNAWIQAFKETVDDDIKFEDAIEGSKGKSEE